MAYLGWMFVGLLLGFGLAFRFRTRTFSFMNLIANEVDDGPQSQFLRVERSDLHGFWRFSP